MEAVSAGVDLMCQPTCLEEWLPAARAVLAFSVAVEQPFDLEQLRTMLVKLPELTPIDVGLVTSIVALPDESLRYLARTSTQLAVGLSGTELPGIVLQRFENGQAWHEPDGR